MEFLTHILRVQNAYIGTHQMIFYGYHSSTPIITDMLLQYFKVGHQLTHVFIKYSQRYSSDAHVWVEYSHRYTSEHTQPPTRPPPSSSTAHIHGHHQQQLPAGAHWRFRAEHVSPSHRAPHAVQHTRRERTPHIHGFAIKS